MTDRDHVDELELDMDRRLPQAPVSDHDNSGGALTGLIVMFTRAADETEDEVAAAAILNLREHHNTHGCTRVNESDPPCTHRNHYWDVAQLRHMLMVLGLPGDLGLLPLGYAKREAAHARTAGHHGVREPGGGAARQ